MKSTTNCEQTVTDTATSADSVHRQPGVDHWAEQVLLGTTLDAKLESFDPARHIAVSTTLSSGSQTPDFPGRPLELSFSRSKDPEHRANVQRFPSKSSLDHAVQRGLVLHFFANHELLAIELMALALLKFPSADEGWRTGIVRTIAEEQAHMRLYMQRMSELGVPFGTLPVNGFFWNCLKNMESPAEFAAAMSMTFEQANLDFAVYYENIFRELGDTQTADILRQICSDEIGHVKHGVVWFERWRDQSLSLWDAWQKTLRFPLTPARAKGPILVRAPRVQAGLPEEFVDRLEVFVQSKGRPANVWWFNPGCEDELAGRVALSAAARALTDDLNSVVTFLAASEDVVLIRQRPGLAWQKSLRAAGFSLPEFLDSAQQADDSVRAGPRRWGAFIPWGRVPSAAFEAKRWQGSVDLFPRELWSKAWSVQLLRELINAGTLLRDSVGPDDVVGVLCETENQIMEHVSFLYSKGWREVVLKRVLAASGRGNTVLDLTLYPENAHEVQKKCADILRAGAPLIVEPWLRRVLDLSVQFDVGADGLCKFIGFSRLLNHEGGSWKGHVMGKPFADTDPGLRRRLSEQGGWLDVARSCAAEAARRMAALGFHGPVGMDALVWEDDSGAQWFKPVVEVNPRLTMGRVAIHLERRIVSGRTGLWRHWTERELKSAGYSSFTDFAQKLANVCPLAVQDHRGVPFVDTGALCTNDPETAQKVLGVLWVGKNLEEVQELLSSLGLSGGLA
jgi:uncharacterized ferritin-like protein (DUF455 family)